jgi:transposase
MDHYIGLDVSMKETAVSIRRDGKRVWRGKCASDPKLIAQLIQKRAPSAKRVMFETGPLSVWFYHALRAQGLPAICIDARHAKAALDMAANKTDANDADGLAHLAEVGFYREVRVKGFDSMLTRTLVAARTRLVRITTELSNQIRGLLKRFGLLVPAGKGSTFEKTHASPHCLPLAILKRALSHCERSRLHPQMRETICTLSLWLIIPACH